MDLIGLRLHLASEFGFHIGMFDIKPSQDIIVDVMLSFIPIGHLTVNIPVLFVYLDLCRFLKQGVQRTGGILLATLLVFQ